jgi:hypothetical protein
MRIRQQCLLVADPDSELLPTEQALLNVGKDGSLGDVDAVNGLLRADPVFWLRVNGLTGV